MSTKINQYLSNKSKIFEVTNDQIYR